MALELALLGPVEARTDGARVPLAPLERSVLTLLALAEGTVLSTERLIDSLWSVKPPAAPRARVQGLISSLRRKIGSALVTRDPGYFLALPAAACDLQRCEELARLAARARPADAAEKLRQALALWHGEPLGGVAAPGVEADRARLAELRVSLLEACFEAELTLGRHAELVREMVAAVAANPLRERLTGQLMTALYRSNRGAEALLAYQHLRERLADELGSDPCADLRELHAAILRGEDPSPRRPAGAETVPAEPEPRPAQMPAGVGHFAGRDADLAALTAALPEPGADPRVVLISGAGGLGKTALAVRWAHTVADRFPDGQIFVDLHGSAKDAALSPGAAVGAALLAIGVNADRLPAGVEERAALFRTRLYHQRVLLVADDAGCVGELLPLVPPTSGSLLVATSRSRLTALTAHHEVRTVALRPLSGELARDLLCAIVGPGRLAGPGGAEVVALCGGWPLTLRQAGATLAARSTQSLGSFAGELRERADTLSVADDPRTVRAALVQARTGLDPAAGRLFDQLGALPVGSVSLELAAAVAGISVTRTRRLLDEVSSANLMVETGPDRYGWYDMVRRYARRCGAALSDRDVAEERAIRWHLSTFERLADRPAPDPELAGAAEGDLPAVARWVAQRGDPQLTWDFVSKAYAVTPAVGVEACEAALAAAADLGDSRTLGAAHTQLGAALLADPARADEAGRHLQRAIQLLGVDQGEHVRIATFALGSLLARQGRPAEAGSLLERTLDLLDPGTEPLASTIALFAHADLLVRTGSAGRGQERFAQALIMCEAATGSRFSRARLVLNAQVGARFLAYLDDCLRAPRVTGPDRRLAVRLFTGVRR
ncbi:BTAD domain-containing putative transcriptional regulator [Actinoplanes sp. NPDC048967]|uniref:AfsR/SARP family transcriptional regulator n=1 Tax=Actinoplanes sp. NPDC048967 TaxID=3155269 RepID=UPI0033E7DC5E